MQTLGNLWEITISISYIYNISASTYLQQVFLQPFASQLSFSNWRKYSFCVYRGSGERHGWLANVSRKAALLCVYSLCSASPHFSPLSSRGKRSERHHFKAHTATYAFPCSRQVSLTRSSHSASWFPQISFARTRASGFLLSQKAILRFALAFSECLPEPDGEIWQSNLSMLLGHLQYDNITDAMLELFYNWHLRQT